jgi:hypothetical protein
MQARQWARAPLRWAASRSAHAAIFALSLRGAEQMAANWSTVAG